MTHLISLYTTRGVEPSSATLTLIVTLTQTLTPPERAAHCRELREFIGDRWFGRDLNGKLVDGEAGFSVAVQQLRQPKASLPLRPAVMRSAKRKHNLYASDSLPRPLCTLRYDTRSGMPAAQQQPLVACRPRLIFRPACSASAGLPDKHTYPVLLWKRY